MIFSRFSWYSVWFLWFPCFPPSFFGFLFLFLYLFWTHEFFQTLHLFWYLRPILISNFFSVYCLSNFFDYFSLSGFDRFTGFTVINAFSIFFDFAGFHRLYCNFVAKLLTNEYCKKWVPQKVCKQHIFSYDSSSILDNVGRSVGRSVVTSFKVRKVTYIMQII